LFGSVRQIKLAIC